MPQRIEAAPRKLKARVSPAAAFYGHTINTARPASKTLNTRDMEIILTPPPQPLFIAYIHSGAITELKIDW
jgi:hypothetical protein